MKATVEFDLYEDQQAFEDFINSRNNSDNDEDVWDKVWRPNFKHGYGKEVDDLIKKCGKTIDANGEEVWHGADLIEKLSEMYLEIKNKKEPTKPRFNLRQRINTMTFLLVIFTAFWVGYSFSFIVETIKAFML